MRDPLSYHFHVMLCNTLSSAHTLLFLSYALLLQYIYLLCLRWKYYFSFLFFSFSQRPQPFEVFITNTTIIPPYSNPHFPLFISFLHNKEGTKAVNRGSWEMAHPYQSRWRMFLILQERGGLFELFRGYGDLGGFSSNVFLLLR